MRKIILALLLTLPVQSYAVECKQHRPTEEIKTLDAEGKGYLSDSEYAKAGYPLTFAQADIDKNGKIDTMELANVNLKYALECDKANLAP